MNKNEAMSAISRSHVAMSAAWQTVKIHGSQGELALLKEAIALCESILLGPGQSSFPRDDQTEKTPRVK